MNNPQEDLTTLLARLLAHAGIATTEQLNHATHKIMSAISDFAAQMTTFQDQQDTAIANLQGDVKSLTDQIAALQASPGTITPADQALLDGIQTRASAVAAKLNALDALTPPVVPAA